MTVMNSNFNTNFLHRLQKQVFDLHSLIIILKVTPLVNSFCSKGTISPILEPNYHRKLPWKIDLSFALETLLWFVNYNLYLIDEFISHHRKWVQIYFDLNISLAITFRSLVCIITNLSSSNSFSKDKGFSPLVSTSIPHASDWFYHW